jgi:phosphoribosylformylglycinamidine synthase PurS subunit
MVRHSVAETTLEQEHVKAVVSVRLKKEVLDPQGDAVKRALTTLGFPGVMGVRVGTLIEIELDPAVAEGAELEAQLKKMADEMLANTVIEDYEVVLIPKRG